MLPKISLLDELRKGGFESSLITTFNAYFPFYEEVVLRRLINAGVRHNVLMMDAKQYAASIANYPPKLAGRRYSLIPIDVPGAFHPKLIMLFGKSKGLVAVGSHNMTLAGFGFNRELTNVVRIQGENDTAGESIAHDAWAAVESWTSIFAGDLPKHATDMVQRCRDFAPWLKSVTSNDHDTRLLTARPGSRSLWQQFTELIEGSVTEISISGAFFDQKLALLQQIQDELRPDHMVVGVDSTTVQLAPAARSLPKISFRQAHSLGLEPVDNEGSSRYLHAKALLVRQSDGAAIFASGSANPSRPAWLGEDGNGNVEVMLVQQGQSAIDAANEVGFSSLMDCPSLDEFEWQQIARNQSYETGQDGLNHKTSLAVVHAGCVSIDRSLLEELDFLEFALIASDGNEISRTKTFENDGRSINLEFSLSQLSCASLVFCFEAGDVVLKVLLHHTREIEEQARTGVQRKFKDALLSLNTDTPNISLLIQCIDKIVFSEDQDNSDEDVLEKKPRDSSQTTKSNELETLAIDVNHIRKRKSKKRLSHTSDLAYLLDALIYHLRIQDFEPIEEIDRYGRTEEEQIEADDGEEAEDSLLSVETQTELLKLCHSKVRTLVNRITAQIKAYKEGSQELRPLLMRLLGVLAVLRELRFCDGRAAWVDKGKTTFPNEERLRLLEAIAFNLFEGTPSLLHMDSLEDELKYSDDIARVKGLVVWLAWDCGLSMDMQKPFMESSDHLAARLRQNAIVLAVAQMLIEDDVVRDEARNSIGSLTSSELDWLKSLQDVAVRCEELSADPAFLRPANEAEPGDIAIHKTIDNWDFRIVSNHGSRFVSLIRLDNDKPHVNYSSDHLVVASLGGTLGQS